LTIIQSITNISIWIVIRDLYPDRQADVKLSDRDNDNGQSKPTGDEAKGKGTPSTEPITPNPIDSSVAGDTHPSVVSQIVAASSGSRQKKKHVPLASKRKQPTPSTDQVTSHIELPPYCGPRSPLDLVAIEIVFGHLFEAFRHTSQAIGTGTLAGLDTQLAKKAWVLPTKKMLAPR
jgi:hypothetical protein